MYLLGKYTIYSKHILFRPNTKIIIFFFFAFVYKKLIFKNTENTLKVINKHSYFSVVTMDTFDIDNV